MDTIHIILGRPWQFDSDATHKNRLNQYILQVGDRIIALMPLQQKINPGTKKNFLVQAHAKPWREVDGQRAGFALVSDFEMSLQSTIIPLEIQIVLDLFPTITASTIVTWTPR